MSPSKTRAERVLAFIYKYCLTPEGVNVGRPIELAQFEIDFIYAVYDNPHRTRRAYLSMARKNGKTTFIACLLLVHLVGPEAVQNSQIISGAQSRDQAALIYNAAEKMINLNPELAKLIRANDTKKMLIGLPMNVTYLASSSEAKTAHGKSGVLVILDEIGQVIGAQDDFIDALDTSQGAYENPLLIAISTQAASDNDLFSIWIDDQKKNKDPQVICHVYAADKNCKLDDPKQWQKANPALGLFRSIDDIRQQAERAKRMPSFENTFRQLTLNQRVATNSPLISIDSWNSCIGEVMPITECDILFGGLDLSSRLDLTSLVLIGRKVNSPWFTYPFFWTPEKGLKERSKRDRTPYDLWAKQGYIRTTPGASIDYDYVAIDIKNILGSIRPEAIAFDRWRIDLIKKEFEKIGIDYNLVEWGQGFKDMAPAVDAIEGFILNKQIIHSNNPVLNMCAANAVVSKSPANDRKLDKSKTSAKIDGMVALAMASGISQRTINNDGNLDDFINQPIVINLQKNNA